VESKKWFNSSLPQTLQIAIVLEYLNAVFALIGLAFGGSLITLILPLAEGVSAFGIANEHRWGYITGVVATILYLMLIVALTPETGIGANIFNLLFSVALVALLLHPHSRDYQRLWFK
jgi:uncharacterized membrane protein YjfL (UPF0719 family)